MLVHLRYPEAGWQTLKDRLPDYLSFARFPLVSMCHIVTHCSFTVESDPSFRGSPMDDVNDCLRACRYAQDSFAVICAAVSSRFWLQKVLLQGQ
jgi:hypothetical protein